MSGRRELGDFVPARLSDGVSVEHAVEIIEPLSQLRSLHFQHLHIRDRAALTAPTAGSGAVNMRIPCRRPSGEHGA
jgi:hypothetical protein